MSNRTNYKHIWILLYIPFFLLGFLGLEGRTDISEYLISSPLDDTIPFWECFVVPYLLWFPYLFGTIAFLVYQGGKGAEQRREFYRFALVLMTGLTLSLLTYVIWPNTLQLRPEVYPRDNIFTDLCASLQGFDTPSNVCPSMHVFSSVVVHIAIWKSTYFRDKKVIRIGSLILMILICMSTMLIKQHSVIDVLCALGMDLLLYFVFYRLVFKKGPVS